MRRLTPPTVATALTALMLASFGAAAPAAAATTDQVTHAGASLHRARVPAERVTIEATSVLPTDRVQFLIAGRLVGEDTIIDTVGSTRTASAEVDLSALRGGTVLRARYYTGRTGLRILDRYFTVVEPAAPLVAPSPTRPGPSTTGVPAGRVLAPSAGLVVSTPGAVVDGLDIDGCVLVTASDVTIRNSRIRCGQPTGGVAVRVSGAQNLVIEDTEIDGLGTAQVGVGWSAYTLRRVNIHGVADGARFGSGVTIESSWIHDMVSIGTLHADALQTTTASNTVIRGNYLDPRNRATGAFHNAAIMLGSETGTRTVRNVLIEGNVLGGGNFSVNVRGDINAETVVVRDNVFESTARYGPVIAPAHVPLGGGNVLTTGAPVTVKLAR